MNTACVYRRHAVQKLSASHFPYRTHNVISIFISMALARNIACRDFQHTKIAGAEQSFT
jgi:hypothetical protein